MVAYFDEVDYLIVKNAVFLANVAYFSLFQDHEVKVIVDVPDDFLRMRDLSLEMLCKVVKCAVKEISEEDQFL